MVDYSTWVSIVRSEADRKGADLTAFEENSAVVSLAAEVWNDRKAELRSASEQEARTVAEGEVTVR
jgi:hypothetical protein